MDLSTIRTEPRRLEASRRWKAKDGNAKDSRIRCNARRRQMVQDLKLARGCTDCGYRKHPEALDFDHRPGTEKLFSLNRMQSHSLEDVLQEIEKCDVVCANCHRVRTASRR